MSIILDALKKAEEKEKSENKEKGEEFSIEASEESEQPSESQEEAELKDAIEKESEHIEFSIDESTSDSPMTISDLGELETSPPEEESSLDQTEPEVSLEDLPQAAVAESPEIEAPVAEEQEAPLPPLVPEEPVKQEAPKQGTILSRASEEKPKAKNTSQESFTEGGETSEQKEPLFSAKKKFSLGKLKLPGLKLPQKKPSKKAIYLGVAVLLLLVAGFAMKDRILGPSSSTQASGNQAQKIVPKKKISSLEEQQKANFEKAKKLKIQAANKVRDNNYDEALRIYARLTLLSPTDPEIYNNYGIVLKRSGQVGEAKKSYEKAMALKPDYPQPYNNLAVIYLSEANYDTARAYFEKAVTLDPNYVDPYLHLGIVFEKSGQNADAVASYKKFLELSAGKVDRRIRLQVEERVAKLEN